MYKIRKRTQQETKLDVNQYIRIYHKIKGGTHLHQTGGKHECHYKIVEKEVNIAG